MIGHVCLQATSLQELLASRDTSSTAVSEQLTSLQSQLDNTQAELANSQQESSILRSELASSQAQHAQQAERARQEQQAGSQQAKAAEVEVKAMQVRLDQATELAASSGRDLAEARSQVRHHLLLALQTCLTMSTFVTSRHSEACLPFGMICKGRQAYALVISCSMHSMQRCGGCSG